MRPPTTWCWRRWTSPDARELWTDRLDKECPGRWALIERTQRRRLLLEAYVGSKSAGGALVARWQGQLVAMPQSAWLRRGPSPTLKIADKLEIVHAEPAGRRGLNKPRLYLPHGMAFGSGEHATTFMLLKAMAGVHEWKNKAVLDVGTGSGALALAARLFGAEKIVATDFDPDAIRTARQNEAMNFGQSTIRWQQGDVRRLKAVATYDLVLANLYSGILVEAACAICRSVAADGQLWLSGILLDQQRGVAAAYLGQGMRLIRTTRRGKWVMLRLNR